MSNTDTPCPHPSIVQLDQGDKITTQCTKCGKKINVRQKSDTDTPRTDEQIWTTDFDHKPCDVVDMPFARELERELAEKTNEVAFWKSKAYEAEQSESKNEAEVERLDHLLADASAINHRLEAEVERLQNGFQGSCYCCEPVGILNQKLEAEVEKLKTEYWFMEAAMSKEINTLKEERDEAIEIAETSCKYLNSGGWNEDELYSGKGGWVTETEIDEVCATLAALKKEIK